MMIKIKKYIQKIIRKINIILFKKNLPNKISIYFHDVKEREIKDIKLIIKFFKYSGYEFCNIDYFNKNLENDKKLIALTFDDGFQSWTELMNLFENENVKSTFFLNTIFFEENPNLNRFYKNINSTGEEELITSDDLNTIIKYGHEIGSHTHTHRTLSQLNKVEFVEEIEINMKFLKNFEAVCFGEPGTLFNHKANQIQRYPWLSNLEFHENIVNISTNTHFFNTLTKRSGLG